MPFSFVSASLPHVSLASDCCYFLLCPIQSPKCHKCFIIRAHIQGASLVQFGRSILFVPDMLSDQQRSISLALGSDIFNGLESASCLFIFCLPTVIGQMCLHLREVAHIVTWMSHHVRRHLTGADCLICGRAIHQEKIYSQFLFKPNCLLIQQCVYHLVQIVWMSLSSLVGQLVIN